MNPVKQGRQLRQARRQRRRQLRAYITAAKNQPIVATTRQRAVPMATTQNLDGSLNEFVDRAQGVAHAIAISSNHSLLGSSRDLPTNRVEQLRATIFGLIGLARYTSAQFEAGAVWQMVMEMDHGFLFLMSDANGSWLVVLASKSCDIGNVGYEMELFIDRNFS